jgi:hypothetical protein
MVILGFAAEGGGASCSGFWHDGSENYWRLAGWYDAEDFAKVLTAKPIQPTHWQPMPPPPIGDNEE